MFAFLVTLLILDALLLSVVVLLQAGQGGGLASLGGGGTDTVLGGRQAVTILTKLSWWCGGIFLALSLVLSGVRRGGSSSALQERLRAATPAAPAQAPLPIGQSPQPSTAPAAPAPPPNAAAPPRGLPRPPSPRLPAPRVRRARNPHRPRCRWEHPPSLRRGPLLPSRPRSDSRSHSSRGDRVTDRPAFVLLEDGAWFAGSSARPVASGFGEVVFTTNLTGYQETFTDPSYLGQIVVMTAPMIGNYGVNEEDMESPHPQVSGVVVRELSRHCSNWRATRSLDEWLASAGVPVIEGVDTRRLTRHLRERGAMRGVVAEGRQPSRELTAQLLASPSMNGLDLASRATVREGWTEGDGPHVVAYDYGMKRNIVRKLVGEGF